jgi:hypothetical protein
LGHAGIGLVVGVLTTSTSVNGPPLLLWLLARGATPGEVRDTLAASFVALNLAGLAVVGLATGALSALDAELLLLAPVVAAGWLAGTYAFRRLGRARFRAVGLALAGVSGVASLVAGLV